MRLLQPSETFAMTFRIGDGFPPRNAGLDESSSYLSDGDI